MHLQQTPCTSHSANPYKALICFFINSKLLKKIMLIMHDRATETPRPLYDANSKNRMRGRTTCSPGAALSKDFWYTVLATSMGYI